MFWKEAFNACRHTYCSNMARAGMNPQDTAVPDGTFGHWRDHEHIYPSGPGGCPERDDPLGRTESGQGRSSESRRREEAVDAEKLQSSLIWERKNERPADRDGQQGFSVARY